MTDNPAKDAVTPCEAQPSMKLRTARTLKWNTIDRVLTQVLYAVVGIVLANVLSEEDFGLVGVLLVFQAFAIILVDSGFGMGLLQKKNPTQTDYSTVFWLNFAVSAGIYGILWFCAPLIADLFHDTRLIGLSRIMFLTFVLNGLAIVQTNRLMKRMDVRMIAISDVIALTLSGALGVWLALRDAGAWALVWQSVALAGIKTSVLWATGKWIPAPVISMKSIREILPVGVSTLLSQLLNTLCLNIYPFIIGAFYASLSAVGIYTQADKWSKMGSASISQILTSTFIPMLSRFQDEKATHYRYVRRINRLTAMILFPAMLGLALVGAPLFHTFFQHKWDAAIVLFQILTIRGIFVVLISLYNNYLVSLARSKAMVAVETIKDVLIFVAIFSTVFFDSVEILVWGQFGASLLTYILVLALTVKSAGFRTRDMLADLLPFAAMSAAACAAAWLAGAAVSAAWLKLLIEIATGAAAYIIILHLARVPELPEALGYLLGRFRKKKQSKT